MDKIKMAQMQQDLGGGAVFPTGEENTAFAKYFVGQSYLNMLTTTGVGIGNVTFEPGCRNNWHIHHKGGQILLVTAGRGYYQEWGKEAQELKPGDVVNIPPEVKHWHGAAVDSWFAHLAVEIPAEGASNEWLEEVSTEDYNKLISGKKPEFQETDPEFAERFCNFAFDEVVHEPAAVMENRDRMMAILAALLGCQGVDEFRVMVPEALNRGVTAVEIREIVYQAAAYLGMGRVRPFLRALNVILTENGYELPLEGQAGTTVKDRLEKGSQAQADIFGEHMKEFYRTGPAETVHINRWLADNCFGDYYTRGGLDYRQREMITFCYLAAQGGCEPQLISHAAANMKIGNPKSFLIAVISQCLPYIGYPRSLNALRCVTEAAEKL